MPPGVRRLSFGGLARGHGMPCPAAGGRGVRNVCVLIRIKAVWEMQFPHRLYPYVPLAAEPVVLCRAAAGALAAGQTSAMVSLAIMSSSSVGMTHTVTRLPGVEMTASSPRTVLFLALSSVTPR